MSSWNSGWRRTTSPGIYSSGTALRIRVRLLDPRTGRHRERNRIVEGVPIDQARALRESMRHELAQQMRDPPRQRVQEFGRYWLRLKKPLIDPGTHARYEDVLEEHAFKELGRIDLRELRTMQVQEWINSELRRGYRVNTVKGWCRVFRTMIQDAIDDLELVRDPSRRIRFPIRRGARGAKCPVAGATQPVPFGDEGALPKALSLGRDARDDRFALLPCLRIALGGSRREGRDPPREATPTARTHRTGHPREARAQRVPSVARADAHPE